MGRAPPRLNPAEEPALWENPGFLGFVNRYSQSIHKRVAAGRQRFGRTLQGAGVISVFVSHPSDRLAMYFGARAEAWLRGFAEVRLNAQARDLDEAELIVAAQGCDALIAYRQTPAPAALFAALPRLAVFLRCAMDIRTVDVAAASAQGVLVTHASAGFNVAVAEWVIAAMLNLGRGFAAHAEAYHRGATPVPAMGVELRGATLGIIGFGGIGRALGRLALAFGMNLLVNTPEAVEQQPGLQQRPLGDLLAQADFVVCLAPANQSTVKLINAGSLATMKPGAFFINASRGELVDEAALLAALDSGHLAGCALDVGMAPDQMPSLALAQHPRVIATPHLAGLTLPAIEHQALEVVAQLHRLAQGQLPDGAVNPEHAARWRQWKA